MSDNGDLRVGVGEQGAVDLKLSMASRHGLIAGATGSGKTVTLQVLAELFSLSGVPVIAPDVKGDLSGIAYPAQLNTRLTERAKLCQVSDYKPHGNPVSFWRLVQGGGHPLRTTVSEMGPMLLSSMLELNDTQESILTLLFSLADQEGLLLLDYKDLEALITWAIANRKSLEAELGSLSPASLLAIKRKVLLFAERGGRHLFGEPALEIFDLIRTTADGRGFINVIEASECLSNPHNYRAFLLWLLAELFEVLPEVGEQEKPRLVFFFDEAHLLFEGRNSALVEKIETVVRLIRSKGVGVYFVTQRPHDIPDSVASQLGNRVQHALRAFTPRERRALKVVADSLPSEPGQELGNVISDLATREAVVSFLDEGGSPVVAQRVTIRPPSSRIGPLSVGELQTTLEQSPLFGKYDRLVDRESAFELLKSRRNASKASTEKGEQREEGSSQGSLTPVVTKMFQSAAKHFWRGFSYRLGSQLMRGLLGSLK